MHKIKRSPVFLVGLTIVLAVAIFLIDFKMPLGVAAATPYIAIVLLAFWAPWWWFVYVVATLAMLLTIIGVYMPAPSEITWMAILNRCLTLVVITIAAAFVAVLKKNEGRFLHTINHATDGIINFDSRGNIEFFNKGAEKIFGYREDEIIGRSVAQLIPTVENSVQEKLIANFPDQDLTGIVDKVSVFQSRDRNGRIFPIEVSISSEGSGARVSYIGILRDISERILTEEKIRILSRAIEQSPVSVVITDAEGTIEYVNEKFSVTSGYSPAEILGKTTNILKSLEAQPDQYQALWETISSGNEWRGIFHNVNKQGDPYWESAVVSPIRNPEGAITHYISVREDITEKLETEKQLAHALKLEATGQMTSGIAHDFNNLLTIISGNLQIIMDDESIMNHAGLREILNDIRSAANDGTELVNRLLLLLRKNKPAAFHVNVNRLLANLRKMLVRMLDRNIEVIVELDKEVNTTFVDPYQLESAILNLTVNARDAMPNGGKLRIATIPVTVGPDNHSVNLKLNPGSYVAILVSDTGIGMDAEVLAHVLEPFYTTKGEGKGTGLGLSMVHSFTRRYGGDVTVESSPGQGTIVTLYLQESIPQDEELKGKPIPGYLPKGKETILVVEDNANVRRFAARSLRNLGYIVLETDNSDAAVEIMTVGDPAIDLLFSDIVIPGRNNGFSLASWVKARDPHCRILLTTGIIPGLLVEQIDYDESLTLLRKPYTLERLAFAVRERLDTPSI